MSTPLKKKMSINKRGIIRNSPIKQMNGISLHQLHTKIPPVKVVRNFISDIEKIKDIQNEDKPMNRDDFCIYLRSHVSEEQLKKIFEILEMEFDPKKEITELCKQIEEERPQIMSPWKVNVVLILCGYSYWIINLMILFYLVKLSFKIIGSEYYSEFLSKSLLGHGALQILVFSFFSTLSYLFPKRFPENLFFSNKNSVFDLKFKLAFDSSFNHNLRHKVFKILGKDTRKKTFSLRKKSTLKK